MADAPTHRVDALGQDHGQVNALWADLCAARRRVAELEGLLAKLEWSGDEMYGDVYEACCPVCRWRESNGHNDGCRLAAALGSRKREEGRGDA